MLSSINSPLNTFTQTQSLITKKSRVPFTREEDDKIRSLANTFGIKKWTLIASYLQGRSAKQCRDRYMNYLVPGYFKGEWSQEEDELLTKLFLVHGPKWSLIMKSFQGRSSNSIKNRWNYFLCRQNSSSNSIATSSTSSTTTTPSESCLSSPLDNSSLASNNVYGDIANHLGDDGTCCFGGINEFCDSCDCSSVDAQFKPQQQQLQLQQQQQIENRNREESFSLNGSNNSGTSTLLENDDGLMVENFETMINCFDVAADEQFYEIDCQFDTEWQCF